MRNRLVFILSGFGLLIGVCGAYYFSISHPPLPPAFDPAANPYAHGLYANGIIESAQNSGSNVNVNPEVSGRVTKIYVTEGQTVTSGEPLFDIEASVPQATAEQFDAQSAAATAALSELKQQPRPEVLAIARAQRAAAEAVLRQASDQFDKLQRARDIDSRAVSQDQFDTANNAVRVASAALDVADRQLKLTEAGAWQYEIDAQEHTVLALRQQAASAHALLNKYTVRAPINARVLAVGVSTGSYVSAQGTYETYTQGMIPAAVLSAATGTLGVRVFVDEILLSRLPAPAKISAQMQVRGTTLKIPLTFVRLQPYVTPKIELSDQRAERVDLRVLPMIFQFTVPKGATLYPGQLVDVYVGSQ